MKLTKRLEMRIEDLAQEIADTTLEGKPAILGYGIYSSLKTFVEKQIAEIEEKFPDLEQETKPTTSTPTPNPSKPKIYGLNGLPLNPDPVPDLQQNLTNIFYATAWKTLKRNLSEGIYSPSIEPDELAILNHFQYIMNIIENHLEESGLEGRQGASK